MPTLLEVLFYVFVTSIGIQLFYFWGIFSRFAFYRKKVKSKKYPPVSIVLCAKNEFINLKKNIPLIINQDYPEFEVVIVNDASDDETIFLLEDMEREHRNITIVNITQDLNFFKGKKFPLSVGIKSAKYENLLLTDADCTPASPNWIKKMASNFSSSKEVVLGYGKYEQEPGWLNTVIRFETLMTAIQYFSYALMGIPYMGVGRNLAYKKSLFLKNNGFIAHYNIDSGDDDLFINEVANKRNTRIAVDPESFTISRAKKTFMEWWLQKRRHLSTSKYYKFKHKFLLGLYSFSLILAILSFIFLLTLKVNILIVLILFGIRLLSQFVIIKKAGDQLMEKKLLLFSPLIELFLLGVFPIMILTNLIIKRNRWK
ncbi:MAG: glycosyltransferase [Bacteroidales bacterium]|nr:glycosyltransferase [Bacteroidales bacterium]